MKPIDRWYCHPSHGFMLRRDDGSGLETVVTSLCIATYDVETDRAVWERHKLRLRVNGGCGAVAVDHYKRGDRNPAFVRVDGRKVPPWIRREFKFLA